jgi:hypothetical protein
MYITPFILMMVYPYRLTLDWDAASISVCEETLQSMSDEGALQLFRLSTDEIIRSKISPELLRPSPSPEDYCAEYGTAWTTTIGTDLSVLQCQFQDPPEQACCAVKELTDAQCAAAQDSATVDETFATLSAYLSTLEKVTSATTNTLDNSKFMLGILMGMYAMKVLLPPVFGLINGLSSALIQFKMQMPKVIAVAYMIVITTVMIIPLLAAFLAAIFQVVGTWALIPSNLFTLLGAGIFAFPCASRWLFDTWSTFGYGSESVVQEKLKSKIRWTIALQMLFYSLAIGFLVVFIYTTSMMSYVNADLVVSFAPQGLTVIIGIYVNTRLSRLTISDAMFVMLDAELEVHEKQNALVAVSQESLATTESPELRDSEGDMKRQLRRASMVARDGGNFDTIENVHALADVQRLHSNDYPRTRADLPPLLSRNDLCSSIYRILINNILYVKEAQVPKNMAGVLLAGTGDIKASESEMKQGPYVAKILYWRFTALTSLVCVFFGALLLGSLSVLNKWNGQYYEGIVEQTFPAELRQFGSKFAIGLYITDCMLLGCLIIPVFCVILGFGSWRNFKRTSRFVRIGWVLFYLIPFFIMLAFPYRALVPYDEVRMYCENVL